MARVSLKAQLAKIERQKKRLEEQERSLRARASIERRKQENQQKMIVGSYMQLRLTRADDERAKRAREWFLEDFPKFLTRPRDREIMAEFIAAVRTSASSQNSDFADDQATDAKAVGAAS